MLANCACFSVQTARKTSLNQFRRQQAPKGYCPNIYIYCVNRQNDLLKDLYQFPLEQLQPQISGLPIDDLLSRQFEAEIGPIFFYKID